jgi:hypothetical protein
MSSCQILSQTNQVSEPGPSKPTLKSKIPCITLDTDVITDAMAARLAMSLLGHILFMKSQVPL